MQTKFEKRRMSEKRTSVRRKSEHYRTALSRDPGFEKQKGPLSSSAWKANARPNRIPRGERGSEKTLIAEERLGGAFVACNSRRSHCGATGERRPQKKGQPRKKKKLSNSSEFPRRWAPNHRAPNHQTWTCVGLRLPNRVRDNLPPFEESFWNGLFSGVRSGFIEAKPRKVPGGTPK